MQDYEVPRVRTLFEKFGWKLSGLDLSYFNKYSVPFRVFTLAAASRLSRSTKSGMIGFDGLKCVLDNFMPSRGLVIPTLWVKEFERS